MKNNIFDSNNHSISLTYSFANCFVFYGLSLNTSVLAGNEYLNFALCAAIELPAYLLVSFYYERVTRRPLYCFCLIAGGIVLLSTLLVPEGKV